MIDLTTMLNSSTLENPEVLAVGLAVGVIIGILSTLLWQIIRHRWNSNDQLKTATQKHSDSMKAKQQPVWHHLSAEEALQKLSSTESTGLPQAEAAERLKHYGYNQLKEKPPRSPWSLFLSQFKSFLVLVLVAAAALAATIGDFIDGSVILIVVVINALLGFYQEFQAEKSLAALKKMLALQAKVRRDGNNIELAAEQLVPGDIVLLEAGDKIPSDGRIIKAHSLEIDESSLTGESLPINKQEQSITQGNIALADRNNMLYMNNAVTRGRAEMLVTATGMETEIGKLAEHLAQAKKVTTPLQLQLDNLGKRLALIAIIIIALLFASALWRGEPLIQTAFTAIALAVAAIPEGLPAVATVTLALGMHRMAKQRAIIKRLSAVETLGCTTVICTDKTGTLTVNQMTARSLFYKNQFYRVSGEGYEIAGDILPEVESSLTEDLTALLQPLALCNDSQIQDKQAVGDPMETALLVLAEKGELNKDQAVSTLPRIAEIPFDAEHKFMATFHRDDSDVIRVFIKGAPEVLLDICSTAIDEKGNSVAIQQQPQLNANKTMAEKGLRVIGVAERKLAASHFNVKDDLFQYIDELTFVGLVGLIDPPRAEAREAIKLCQRAGIEVKMITGDQKVTAFAIAQELDLAGEVLEGEEIEDLNDKALAHGINSISVFARTAPEQKVQIVKALQADGHIVAMTGDGVNDAAALKTADIGIAMGITGTDVAQEAATMVLTDDNFATIVKAIKEGRGIYANIVKFVRFQLSTNIGAILTVACAPLLGMPIPFTAVQLLWVNIIMDGPPAMALGVDPAPANSMSQVPRNSKARILSLHRLGNLMLYGLTMAVGTLGVLYYSLQTGETEHAVTLAFSTFVLFQVFNIFNARAENGTAFNRHIFTNKMLWLSIFSVILLQIIIVQWPPAQAIFHTTTLTQMDWLIATAVAAFVLILEELRKLLWFIANKIFKKSH